LFGQRRRFIGLQSKTGQPSAESAVLGDRKGPVAKDALQFERMLASGFVSRGIFRPGVWSDLNLLGDMR